MPKEICSQEKCTGCFACMNICPKDAITKGVDEYSKTIPLINREKCIECGLCVKVCPANHLVKFQEPKSCYAAWAKEDSERKGASSGGIAAAFSRAVINERGVVYGAAFDDDLKLVHTAAQSEGEIQKFKGSKYVQSYVGFSFRQVKENLKKEKKVLFIGTPCQIAGLKFYLGKEYENLITIDIICHGTPPMKYLEEYLSVVDPQKKAKNLTFRGEKDFCFTLYDEQKAFYCVNSDSDFYFHTFLKGLTYRDNCYTCEWAKSKRCSDITIGDFWGLNRTSLKEFYDGKISVILINTLSGEHFWEDHKEEFYYEQREVEEAVNGNAQLRKPSVCHPDREIFLKEYKEKGFFKAVKTPRVCREIRKGKIKSSTLYLTARKLKRRFFCK